MNGRVIECIIQITTNKCQRRVNFFFHSHFPLVCEYESESRFPSKNHQSIFTAIMSDIRMRTHRIHADIMIVLAMMKTIVQLFLHTFWTNFLLRNIASFSVNNVKTENWSKPWFAKTSFGRMIQHTEMHEKVYIARVTNYWMYCCWLFSIFCQQSYLRFWWRCFKIVLRE